MTADPPVTVLFRMDRSGPFKGEVTAVMPYYPANGRGDMTCYVHVGQHASCSLDWYWQTRAATPVEYAPLLAELRSIGYTVIVARRINYDRRCKAAQAARSILP